MDNRRCNLRLATHQENCFNIRKRDGTSSKYKGVYFDTQNARTWRARIARDGKRRHLGSFRSEVEAAKAYDAAAKELFGEFAWLNFPGDQP